MNANLKNFLARANLVEFLGVATVCLLGALTLLLGCFAFD